MGRRIDEHGAVRDVTAFYDRVAPMYDAMTAPTARMVRERPFFSRLVEQYGIGTAVDAGSGTGFHALLLSQLGVRVTAVDLSQEMLTRLADNAAAMKLTIPTVQVSLQEMSAKLPGTYDAVVCMGNTLAHLLTREGLEEVVREFASIIRPGGVLLLQVLNYERILSRQERIQSVREEPNGMIVRFYDFGEPLLKFNILRLVKRDGGVSPELSSIDMRPVLLPELKGILAAAGFGETLVYGDITMSTFDPSTSSDLIVATVRDGAPNVA
jgi:glycine/sarcosine N-methyltransferase